MNQVRIFVGYDSRTPAAFWILRASILRHSPEVQVYPIVQQLLRMQGRYYRPPDPLAATEFTYTRFLVPYLANYEGLALFMDCDMLVRGDLVELFDEFCQKGEAVSCVQHDHHPPEDTKMAGEVQTLYPRKNWSSLVLYNCGHPANCKLSVASANQMSGAELHQFKWLKDHEIGSLPLEWNWLEGWNTVEECSNPKVVHFTRGIPGIHPGYSHVAYAQEYLDFANTLKGDLL